MVFDINFGRRRRSPYDDVPGFLLGAATGAGLAFFGNRRRRAYLRDKLYSYTKHGWEAANRKALDLAHRTKGTFAELRGRFEGPVPDDILVERVRAALGHVTNHAHAIEVHAEDGDVRLSGPVDAREHARIFRAVEAVRGVHGLEDHTHAANAQIPMVHGFSAH